MIFRPIHLKKDLSVVRQFRRDSFVESFGNDDGFDSDDYIAWLKENIRIFPSGFVMAEEHGRPVGQIELSIRRYEGRLIGYVHLYYLIPEERGEGKGRYLLAYSEDFFRWHRVKEYHLRVSPTNTRAVKFYKKSGLREVGTELNGKVVRLNKEIEID
ncbi:GNAT family N-acetyltransferase [Halobacillus sp. A5]|uniref:GNAT family N-acetyltransferase n=1 Tax=Halobacillus sp. A5 TaxID=2880263 RepID=UPI0020A6774B|nr:GNAT family N-acetyltransferase [Halobacillus sp. A5]MCP3026473.1 GNAT family N-acetyltransferase [Halobacillus sp. A5]